MGRGTSHYCWEGVPVITGGKVGPVNIDGKGDQSLLAGRGTSNYCWEGGASQY